MIALFVVALALAQDQPAKADPVHDAVQQLIYDVQDGVDFTGSRFAGVVKTGDASKLGSLKPCSLGSVSRTQGDAMALIHWSCPAETKLGSPTTMVMFESGKVVSIEMASYVDVPVRGN